MYFLPITGKPQGPGGSSKPGGTLGRLDTTTSTNTITATITAENATDADGSRKLNKAMMHGSSVVLLIHKGVVLVRQVDSN